MSTKARRSAVTEACYKWDIAVWEAWLAKVQPPEDAPELRAIVLQAAAAVGWPRLADDDDIIVPAGEASWRQWAEEEEEIENVVSILFVLGTAEDMRLNGCDPGPPELWHHHVNRRIDFDLCEGDDDKWLRSYRRRARG